MTAQQTFEFGDRVRHRKRPEWGIGSVQRLEHVTLNGQPTLRVTVRFPNAGTKTLSADQAALERIDEAGSVLDRDGPGSVEEWDRLQSSDFLAPVAQRKIEAMMTALPPEAMDPFRSLRDRLETALALYRFDSSGRGLIDWAVAQTRLDDPLSRFSRQELEQHFERWATERDAHLRKILQEARSEPGALEALLATAPAAARSAVQRIIGRR